MLGTLIWTTQNTDTGVTIILNTILSLSDQIIFISLKSMHDIEYKLENFNLFIALTFTTCLALITDFVVDKEQRAQHGVWLCLIVLTLVAINIVFVVITMVKQFH